MSRAAILAAVATLSTACGYRAAARVTAWTAHYPVSLTATVLDRSFRPVPPGDLVRVGGLAVDREACGVDATVDLSTAVDDAVAAAAGEAVVNVHATAAPPGERGSECARVRVQGDVVRRRYGAVDPAELERGCAHGRADLCVGLASRRLAGDGVARDPSQAVAALDRGCERGSTWSCSHLSALLAEGQAVPRDLPRAMAAAGRACGAGLGEACVAQAALLAREDNPAADLARAREIVEGRCQRGSMHACAVLADVVGRDPRGAALAARLRERACIGRYLPACATPTAPAGAERAVVPPPAEGGPIARGLRPEAIRAVVLANMAQVSECHGRALAQDPTATGRVVIQFVIAGDGAVMRTAVGSAPPGGASGAAACIAQAIATWRFPPPAGGIVVNVNYPFNLTPE
ncbi:MAG: AgmX/PglI C-terminal domain-containing protein [Polyangiales bacterium]